MIPILPLSTDHHCTLALEASIFERLTSAGLGFQKVSEIGSVTPVLLILSGGTEHLALQAIQPGEHPVVVLAHGNNNSLPAALEVAARLRQGGRRGIVFQIDGDEQRLGNLVNTLNARQQLSGQRLGRIGTPSDWLVASSPDAKIVKQTWDIELVELEISDLLAETKVVPTEKAQRLAQTFQPRNNDERTPDSRSIASASKVYFALQKLKDRHNLDALTVRCFDLVESLQTTGCLALSQLNDEGIVAGCEGDVPATLTMMLLTTLTKEPSFIGNPQSIDSQNNTLWLTHCTIARNLVDHWSLDSHFESGLGVGIAGTMAPGPITLARFGGSNLDELFVSDGAIVGVGNSPQRCRTQLEIRLELPVREILENPLGNHHVMVKGHWAHQVREFHNLFF
ncbi:MAG: hypothetical protein HN348_09985 [Proteobacteria bacterium]|nr:hypothetical protein [Pseudomonadota bacterium]